MSSSKKVPQLYPDLTKVRIAWYKDAVDAVIIHKNVSRYAVAFSYGDRKEILHVTEKYLTQLIEEAKIIDSPLYNAMKEEE